MTAEQVTQDPLGGPYTASDDTFNYDVRGNMDGSRSTDLSSSSDSLVTGADEAQVKTILADAGYTGVMWSDGDDGSFFEQRNGQLHYFNARDRSFGLAEHFGRTPGSSSACENPLPCIPECEDSTAAAHMNDLDLATAAVANISLGTETADRTPCPTWDEAETAVQRGFRSWCVEKNVDSATGAGMCIRMGFENQHPPFQQELIDFETARVAAHAAHQAATQAQSAPVPVDAPAEARVRWEWEPDEWSAQQWAEWKKSKAQPVAVSRTKAQSEESPTQKWTDAEWNQWKEWKTSKAKPVAVPWTQAQPVQSEAPKWTDEEWYAWQAALDAARASAGSQTAPAVVTAAAAAEGTKKRRPSKTASDARAAAGEWTPQEWRQWYAAEAKAKEEAAATSSSSSASVVAAAPQQPWSKDQWTAWRTAQDMDAWWDPKKSRVGN